MGTTADSSPSGDRQRDPLCGSCGCSWRQLPGDLPPWATVYDYFALWNAESTVDRIYDRLRDVVWDVVRDVAGRDPMTSSRPMASHRGPQSRSRRPRRDPAPTRPDHIEPLREIRREHHVLDSRNDRRVARPPLAGRGPSADLARLVLASASAKDAEESAAAVVAFVLEATAEAAMGAPVVATVATATAAFVTTAAATATAATAVTAAATAQCEYIRDSHSPLRLSSFSQEPLFLRRRWDEYPAAQNLSPEAAVTSKELRRLHGQCH